MRCLHESMSSREERAEMKRRRVLMRIERKGEEGALRARVCLCVCERWRGAARRGEGAAVSPRVSTQHDHISTGIKLTLRLWNLLICY